jgi:hypothetical protein
MVSFFNHYLWISSIPRTFFGSLSIFIMKQASEIGERDNVTDRLWAEADAGECNCG